MAQFSCLDCPFGEDTSLNRPRKTILVPGGARERGPASPLLGHGSRWGEVTAWNRSVTARGARLVPRPLCVTRFHNEAQSPPPHDPNRSLPAGARPPTRPTPLCVIRCTTRSNPPAAVLGALPRRPAGGRVQKAAAMPHHVIRRATEGRSVDGPSERGFAPTLAPTFSQLPQPLTCPISCGCGIGRASTADSAG